MRKERIVVTGVHLGAGGKAPPDVRRPPLALGMVWAYARKILGADEAFDLEPRFVTQAEDIDGALAGPGRHVVLFSDYIWNVDGNRAVSRRVKEIAPDAITIHGGANVPSYPGECEEFLRRESHVDYTVRGEGEKAFVELLRAIAHGDPKKDVLANVSTLSDGRFVQHPLRERTADLEEYPSPYLTGFFDDLMARTGLESATIETNRGCPYGCTFCDWGAATLQKVRMFSMERIRAELEWIARHQIPAMWIADANFGIFPRDLEIARLVVETKQRFGFPKRLTTNYAKNTQQHLVDIIETFLEAGLISTGIISVQTRDDRTLETVRRKNIKTREYDKLREAFARRGLPLATQIMIGLPGATVRSMMADLSHYFDEPIEVQIFRTVLLPNSPMAEPSYRAAHRIEARDDGLITSTASMSESDFRRATLIVRQYNANHHFGILRYPLVFLRREHGLDPLDVMCALVEDEGTLEARYPLLWEMLDVGGNPLDLTNTHAAMMERRRAEGSWPRLLDEFAAWTAERLGAARDGAFDAVLAAQAAVLPTAGRAFPHEVALAHDVVAWYAEGRRATDARALRTYRPGTLVVEDPLTFSSRPYVLKRATRLQWELASPLARARVGTLGGPQSNPDLDRLLVHRDVALPWAVVTADAAAM